jgi:hypothetical protein
VILGRDVAVVVGACVDHRRDVGAKQVRNGVVLRHERLVRAPVGSDEHDRVVTGMRAVARTRRVVVTAGRCEGGGGARPDVVDVEAVKARGEPPGVHVYMDAVGLLSKGDDSDASAGAVGQERPGVHRLSGYAHDRLVERYPTGASFEGGVAVGEDAAVRSGQPVTRARWCRRHADDRPVEGRSALAAIEGRRALGEHSAVRGHHPVAAGERGGS